MNVTYYVAWALNTPMREASRLALPLMLARQPPTESETVTLN